MKAKVSSSRIPIGSEGDPPAEWALYTGGLPKRGTQEYHVESRWPRYRVLNKTHAHSVLSKYHRDDCPGQIQRQYIQYYVRNFDSEGFLVDSDLTALLPREALPLGHRYAQMSMEELHRDGNKRQSAGRKQKAIKLALSSAATNYSKSSGGKIHANNTNSKSSTCTILNTSTGTATGNAQRKVASAAAGNITTPTTFVAEGGRQLGGQTSETTSTKSKEPLVVLKRLAEPQKLRSEVKRLKTENDEQESKLEDQTLVLAKLDQTLCQKMREVDQLGESVEDLKKALEEKEEEKSALEDQSRQQETENSELSKRLEEVVNAKLAMEADLQRQMDRCDDVERQRAALEAEVGEKKRRFEGMEKIVKQAVSDQQDSMLELKEKGKRLEGLEKDLKKADREKAAIGADLKKEQEKCEKVQDAKDRKDQLAESAKRSTARLLHIINSIYDSIGDEGTEERDEILGAVRNDLGGYWYDSLLTWGKSLAQQK
ncbi:uncharacterized protein IWZ02DRAFT_508121 [Phyllosticta citriasiana]|uniref:uncharacterized protein n=1 Tax=Phyllosticta citriasiana TaxID=595635 RepID=UPI0030FD37B0